LNNHNHFIIKKFKFLFVSFVLICLIFNANAQGYSLKFNRVFIINNNEQTVPTGTVWKVTSIYGEEINFCINVVCFDPNIYAKGIVSGIYVNNVFIPSTIRGFKNSMERFSSSNCTTGSFCCSDVTCANKTTDPNILPLWLPEGTTIKTLGPNTFASVIEFIVQ